MAVHESTAPADDAFAAVVRRARAEYLEMPGLQLTIAQATRLWALDAAICRDVLANLVEARFLVCTRKALFTRMS
jgi:hypothetical protein